MLNINITIDDGNLAIVKALFEKRNKQTKAEDADLFKQVLDIISPFADKTLSTIPPSAIAQLFDLLGKEKVPELAKEYGITISDIQVTAPHC